LRPELPSAGPRRRNARRGRRQGRTPGPDRHRHGRGTAQLSSARTVAEAMLRESNADRTVSPRPGHAQAADQTAQHPDAVVDPEADVVIAACGRGNNMSIAVLTQVYDEMRRLAVAGSVVAGGDFRLKKLVPALEQAGAKAPVFAKVAQAVKAVVDGGEKSSATSLLELTTLVNAILYTQGETGSAGALEAIETTDLGMPTAQASARMLKPLLEALTT